MFPLFDLFASAAEAAEPLITTSEVVILVSNVLVAVTAIWLTLATNKARKTSEEIDSHQQEHLTNALSDALKREQSYAHEEEADK